MTDIVERLRLRAGDERKITYRLEDGALDVEAADEIERLRELRATDLELREADRDQIERLRAADKLARQFSSVGLIGALEDENGRLREILRIIWVAYQDNDGIRKIFHEAGLP